MSLSQPTATTPAAPRRAVTPAGRWIDDIDVGTDPTLLTSHHATRDVDLGLAAALLSAATRMHDSPDLQSVLRVIADEALCWVPADAVVVVGHDHQGRPTPLFQLSQHTRTDDALSHLFVQLATAQLLQPGSIDEVALQRARLDGSAAEGTDRRRVAPWRSALVADLDSTISSRPTRLLWCFTTTLPVATGAVALFARHAGLALRAVSERHHLHQAVEARTATGQATGILMNRYQITAARAFELLRRCSQNRNLKISDIADILIRTGQLPS